MSKISAYSSLPRSSLRHDDLLVAVDVHDTTMAATGTDKNLTIGAMRPGNVFWLDDYGADPTGTTASDSAWTAAYTAASAAVLTHSGAMIVAGAGTYAFTPGTVAITDGRIGLRGQGRSATLFTTNGTATGSLVKLSAITAGNAYDSAPCGGFSCYGWNTTSAVNGIEYGDRGKGCLTDVAATGFGAAGSRGFWFHDTTGLSEGSFVVATADQNTVNFDFDRTTSAGSFDYSQFFLHMVCTTAGGSSAIGMRFSAGQHCHGGVIHLAGNISATTGLTSTCLQVGNSTTDTSYIQNCQLNIVVEGDTSAGTIKDAVVQGASGFGILTCTGQFVFANISGTYAAGSVTSPAVFTASGHFTGPLFTSHGTLTLLGPAANTAGLSVYQG